jgi:hypothetical protein
MPSTLAKSLLIDFLLASISLSHADNARDIVAARHMGDNSYSTGEPAQGDELFLPIIETVIYEGDTKSAQHMFGVREIQNPSRAESRSEPDAWLSDIRALAQSRSGSKFAPFGQYDCTNAFNGILGTFTLLRRRLTYSILISRSNTRTASYN